MVNPKLIVVAGCNGSGKSSYSNLLSLNVVPFDYDKEFLRFYNSMPDSELRETMAHNQTMEFLKTCVENAIKIKADFCYEHNFHSSPLYWPTIFKAAGYETEIFFFCLDSIEEAERRVIIRFENGGHFVRLDEIIKRFHEGYKNMDTLYQEFDIVHLFNSSFYDQEPHYILSISNGNLALSDEIPSFLKTRLPNICSLAKPTS